MASPKTPLRGLFEADRVRRPATRPAGFYVSAGNAGSAAATAERKAADAKKVQITESLRKIELVLAPRANTIAKRTASTGLGALLLKRLKEGKT